jgi:hypothetical protein
VSLRARLVHVCAELRGGGQFLFNYFFQQTAPLSSSADGDALKAEIDTQGELVRTLKSGGGSAVNF